MKGYDKWAGIFENLFGLCFGIWIVAIFVDGAIHPLKYWFEISGGGDCFGAGF